MAKKRNRQEPEQQEADGESGPHGSAGDAEVDPMALDEAVSSESEDDGDARGAPPPAPRPVATRHAVASDGRYHNKQRLLLLASRGVTARYRHLLEDLRTLIPHSKKESKLDAGKNYGGGGQSGGGQGAAVNEIAEIRGCHTVLFLECRKRGQDGYLWLGRTTHANAPTAEDAAGGGRHLMLAGGPSVKFHLTNLHTMDELKMTGNCMKGSRPLLSFDKSFEAADHLRLIKHLFVDAFGTPRGHPKSKPFVDRVMGFYYVDGKIWVRNYQILEEAADTAREAREAKHATGRAHATSLVEIGPRFVLDPIRVFRGSFGGQTLWANSGFVTPSARRGAEQRQQGDKYAARKGAQRQRRRHEEGIVVPEDPLADVFRE